MSFLDRVRSALGLSQLPGGVSPSLASPWVETTHLSPIVLADIWGEIPRAAVTREHAIRIPAVSRARGLIAGTIARLPLIATTTAGDPADLPAWLVATTGTVSPLHRMLWTADDLFFYGWSLWAVDRDALGTITAAERVPYDQWSLDSDGYVRIGEVIAPADAVILIPGTDEGILSYGADTLSQAVRLAAAATRAAENPSAQVELHQTNEAPITEPEIDALVKRWAAARRGEHGGVAFTTSAIEVREHGASSEHLLIEGRNAAAVDIARHAGLPATMLDATLSGSSLSYQNTAARMSELITFGLSPLMAAIAARLSQDDVTPHGVGIAFDTASVIEQLRDLFKSNDIASGLPPTEGEE